MCSWIRKILAGHWREVWEESKQAAVDPTPMKRTEAKQSGLDTHLIRGALQEEDTRADLRIVDGRVSIAPEERPR